MVATAIIGGAVVAGAGTAIAGHEAASAQSSAANQANATSRNFFNTSKGELQPFIDTGTSAANKLSELQGLNGGTPSSIMTTLQGLPGYQFANYQGLKSVQNSATARGLGVSGAAQKAASGFATGEANQYYNNLLTGLQNTENTGAGAAGTLTGAATATGSQIGQNQIGVGNANAANSIATGNAFGTAANSVGQGLIASSLLQNLGNQGGIYDTSKTFDAYGNGV